MSQKVKYKITEYQQTRNIDDKDATNTLEFICNGIRYHGNGKTLHSCAFLTHAYHYKWEIFDENENLMFSFGASSPITTISKTFLSKYLRKTIEERERGFRYTYSPDVGTALVETNEAAPE